MGLWKKVYQKQNMITVSMGEREMVVKGSMTFSGRVLKSLLQVQWGFESIMTGRKEV